MSQLRGTVGDHQDLTPVMRLNRLITIAAVGLLLGAGCRAFLPGPEPQPPGIVVPVLTPEPSAVLLEAQAQPTASLLATEEPTPGRVLDAGIPPMPPRELAMEKHDIPSPEPPPVGTTQTFRVADLQAAGYREVHATLEFASAHVAMWVAEGVTVSQAGLAASARAIEERILPVLAQIYPADPLRNTQTYAVLNLRTSGAAGYYASMDDGADPGAPPLFVMNLAAVRPGTDAYDSVLAHEIQHVLQAATDPNEAAWVTEGASQLVQTLAGYPAPLHAVSAFAAAPGLQLNTWSGDDASVFRHYGASFLLLQYLYERHGLAGLQLLLNAPEDGTAALNRVLGALDGSGFRDLYADWTVANLLDAPETLNGTGGYAEIDLSIVPQDSVSTYPMSLSIAIPPYAAHYVELLPEQGAAPFSHTLRLEGPAWTRLVPVDVRAGTSMWWSNRGDAGHSWLERRIDLRGVSKAELTYDLWYDIEWGWDWAGVRVSLDEGENWEWVEGLQSVVPPPGTGAPDVAYTGRSGGEGSPDGSRPAEWVQERIDLGPYAGREILVRFDMVTDDAVNEPGLCIDNLAIDAIEWRDGDEASDNGWLASGFAPIGNQVPLEYLVQAVTYAGEDVSVRRLEATAGHGEWHIADRGGDNNRVVLVISALTDPVGPISTEDIRFTLTIDRAP